MSETLSALIAFVGFLIVFSTLIQSFQEALKNLLKLKVGVWERFIYNLYSKELSSEGGSTPVVRSFRERVRSDLKRIGSWKSIGEFDQRLQRLKEMVMKGEKLLKAFKTTLYDIALLDSSTSDFNKQFFLKIGELMDALREIVGLRLDALLGIYDKNFAREKIKNLYKALKDFESQYSNLPNPTKALEASVIKTFQEACNKLIQSINEVEGRVTQFRLQIESKIDAWLTEVNEVYKRNMLKWTFIIGLIFVVVFNADSLSIYRYLMVDSKAQTAVVQKAAEATAKIQKTKADELNEIEKAITENDVSKAKEKVVRLATTMQGDFETYGAKDKAEKAKGIKAEMEKPDPKAKESLKGRVGELTQLYVDLQKESVAYQLKGFTSLDLPLGWTADCKKLTSEWNEGSTVGQKILIILKKVGGLLMTAFLITFGAPFWNDILSALMGVKNLTSKKK